MTEHELIYREVVKSIKDFNASFHWDGSHMEKCSKFATIVMDEMNRTMYKKIHSTAYDFSFEKAATDLCSYAVQKSKDSNSKPFVAQLANCWKGYGGDCWHGGSCKSTCGHGGYCCSKIKLKDNHDCPAGKRLNITKEVFSIRKETI